MIPSEELCGRCAQPYFVKAFRGAEILVCQGCQTVTLQKADFKRILESTPEVVPLAAPAKAGPGTGGAIPLGTRAPARPVPVVPAPAPAAPPPPVPAPPTARRRRYDDEPSLGPLETEETDEFARGPELGTMAPTEVDVPEPAFDLAPSAFVQPSFQIGALPVAPRRGPAVVPSGPDEVDLPEPDLEVEVPPGWDDGLDDEYPVRRGGLPVGLLLALGAVLLVGALGVGAAVLGAGLLGSSPADDATLAAVPTPGPVQPVDAAPVPAPAPAAPVVPAPTPAPVPSPAGAKPSPAPAPAPAPAAPTGPPTVTSLVRQGWVAFERSPAEAAPLFQQALALRADHADANYGYGYALLKQQRAAEAAPYLCKARDGGDAEISRDIRSLLSHNGLTCP